MHAFANAIRPALNGTPNFSEVHGNQTNHINSFSGQKPRPCPIPGCKRNNFSSDEALADHVATHPLLPTGPRLKCTKGCDRTFGSKADLLAHEASSTHRTPPFSLWRFMWRQKWSSFKLFLFCCVMIYAALPVAWRYMLSILA